MATLAELLKSALTEASAPQTKESPTNTREWATWFKLDETTLADMEPAIRAAAAWAKAFRAKATPRWLTITGHTGTGKTHIARCCFTWAKNMRDTSQTNYVVTSIYWPAFVAELKAGEAWERIRDMARWPVLFLDDIGAERDTSGFATEQLNTLLGQRVDRWTILTSNLLLPQLAAIEPRIADRIIRKPNLRAELNCTSYARRKAAQTPTP